MSNMTLSEKELKIGNLLQWEDESKDVIIITGINVENESCYIATNKNELAELGEFIPVLLTEERLTKLGFEEELFWNEIHTKDYYKESVGILNITGDSHIRQLRFEMKCCQVFIRYVHQLQNLYFALTRNELTTNNFIS